MKRISDSCFLALRMYFWRNLLTDQEGRVDGAPLRYVFFRVPALRALRTLWALQGQVRRLKHADDDEDPRLFRLGQGAGRCFANKKRLTDVPGLIVISRSQF
jgi:hypothetical protein